MVQVTHYLMVLNSSVSSNTPPAHTPVLSTSYDTINTSTHIVRSIGSSLHILAAISTTGPPQDPTECTDCCSAGSIMCNPFVVLFALYVIVMLAFGACFVLNAWLFPGKAAPIAHAYSDEFTETTSLAVYGDSETLAERIEGLRQAAEHAASIARCGIVNKWTRDVDIGTTRAFTVTRSTPIPVPSYGAMEGRNVANSLDSPDYYSGDSM